jgi:hypothetical protein
VVSAAIFYFTWRLASASAHLLMVDFSDSARNCTLKFAAFRAENNHFHQHRRQLERLSLPSWLSSSMSKDFT